MPEETTAPVEVEVTVPAPLKSVDQPEAATAEVTSGDFADHPLCTSMADHIDKFGGYAAARLHQLLDEMRALFNA